MKVLVVDDTQIFDDYEHSDSESTDSEMDYDNGNKQSPPTGGLQLFCEIY